MVVFDERYPSKWYAADVDSLYRKYCFNNVLVFHIKILKMREKDYTAWKMLVQMYCKKEKVGMFKETSIEWILFSDS